MTLFPWTLFKSTVSFTCPKGKFTERMNNLVNLSFLDEMFVVRTSLCGVRCTCQHVSRGRHVSTLLSLSIYLHWPSLHLSLHWDCSPRGISWGISVDTRQTVSRLPYVSNYNRSSFFHIFQVCWGSCSGRLEKNAPEIKVVNSVKC